MKLDPELELAVCSALMAYVKRVHQTQVAAAKHWNVTPAFVCSVLAGFKSPTRRMLRDAEIELEVKVGDRAVAEPNAGGATYGIIDPDYGRVYTITRKLAWDEGYAIGLHGSFTRDLDLIAVPWVDKPSEPEHLVRRIVDATGLKTQHGSPGQKPQGRLVWTLLFPAFADPRFVDLSIMPRLTE